MFAKYSNNSMELRTHFYLLFMDEKLTNDCFATKMRFFSTSGKIKGKMCFFYFFS